MSHTSTTTVTHTHSGTSTTTISTTETTTTGTPCYDHVPEGQHKWHDSLGVMYDCAWYASASGMHCGSFAVSAQGVNFGMTANEACCACGGGLHHPTTMTNTTTTTTECEDFQPPPPAGEWHDNTNHRCAYFARLPAACYHGTGSPWGITAAEACCVCGGGAPPTDTVTTVSTTTVTTITTSRTTTSRTVTATQLPPPIEVGSAVQVASADDDDDAVFAGFSFAALLAFVGGALVVCWCLGLLTLKFICGYPLQKRRGVHVRPPPRGQGKKPQNVVVDIYSGSDSDTFVA